MNKIIVFTDGSFMKNKVGLLCGYGIYFPNGEFNNVGEKCTIKPLTNQRDRKSVV